MHRVSLRPLERAHRPIVEERATIDAEGVHDESIQAALPTAGSMIERTIGESECAYDVHACM